MSNEDLRPHLAWALKWIVEATRTGKAQELYLPQFEEASNALSQAPGTNSDHILLETRIAELEEKLLREGNAQDILLRELDELIQEFGPNCFGWTSACLRLIIVTLYDEVKRLGGDPDTLLDELEDPRRHQITLNQERRRSNPGRG